MPAKDPLIGEVWETEDVAGNGRSLVQAAVADVHPNQVFLLGRNGRVVVLPLKSFILLWGLVDQAYTPQQCMTLNCNSWSCAHTLDNRWFCYKHLPRNAPLLLPGDNAEARRTLIGEFSVCPLCKEKTKISWQLVHDLLVYSCPCNARWIMLIMKGTNSDGLYLGEDIQSAHTILETELCLDIKVRMGRMALASLKSLFREISSPPRFAGLPIIPDDSMGTTNVLLTGKPPAANVMDGSIRLSSFWAHSKGFVFLRAIAVEDDVREDREVVLIDTARPDHVVRLPENVLKEEFHLLDHLNLLGSPNLPEAPEVADFERWPTVTGRHKSPLPGEVWWHEYSMGAVQVFGLGADTHGTDFVRIQQDRQSFKMILQDFLRFNSFGSQDQTGILVGGEYGEANNEEETFIVREIDNREVTVESTQTKLKRSVRITDFRSSFEHIVRQSALDVLMDDDDLV